MKWLQASPTKVSHFLTDFSTVKIQEHCRNIRKIFYLCQLFTLHFTTNFIFTKQFYKLHNNYRLQVFRSKFFMSFPKPFRQKHEEKKIKVANASVQLMKNSCYKHHQNCFQFRKLSGNSCEVYKRILTKFFTQKARENTVKNNGLLRSLKKSRE